MRLLLFECLHWKGFLESSTTVFHNGLMKYLLTEVTEKPCLRFNLRRKAARLCPKPGYTDALMPCFHKGRHINPRPLNEHYNKFTEFEIN